jgi:hypothetical protein
MFQDQQPDKADDKDLQCRNTDLHRPDSLSSVKRQNELVLPDFDGDNLRERDTKRSGKHSIENISIGTYLGTEITGR